MARRSFDQRFPAFKWVFLLAVIITLPLTVFSVKNVSTNTSQYAAPLECNGLCPAPTNLTSSSKCSKGTTGPNIVTFNLHWNRVPNESSFTKYYIYWRTLRKNGSVSTYDTISTKNNSYSFTKGIPQETRFYWHVKAYSSYTKTFGSPSVTREVVLNCK